MIFSSFLKDKEIEFQHPCPYTSQQNGIVERKHRHIVEMGLTLLAQASMPLRFWWDAFVSAVYIINRLPTPVLDHLSPWEKSFQRKPNYFSLKSFGCACFPCFRPYQTHKFQFHSTLCVFLGYNETHKGYKCLSSSGRTYISRDVIFNEIEFPFKNGFLTTSQPKQQNFETIIPFPSSPTRFSPFFHHLHLLPHPMVLLFLNVQPPWQHLPISLVQIKLQFQMNSMEHHLSPSRHQAQILYM